MVWEPDPQAPCRTQAPGTDPAPREATLYLKFERPACFEPAACGSEQGAQTGSAHHAAQGERTVFREEPPT